MTDERDERRVPISPDRCSTTSESSNNDQTKKSLIEIIDKQVFTSYSNSNIITDLFVLPNRSHIFLMNMLVSQLIGIYIESKCGINLGIIMILVLLHLLKR